MKAQILSSTGGDHPRTRGEKISRVPCALSLSTLSETAFDFLWVSENSLGDFLLSLLTASLLFDIISFKEWASGALSKARGFSAVSDVSERVISAFSLLFPFESPFLSFFDIYALMIYAGITPAHAGKSRASFL